MKITLQDIQNYSGMEEDEYHPRFQKFKTKKRNLSARRNLDRYVDHESAEYSFKTSDLEDLRGRGVVEELLRVIKSGKEASVYLGRNGDEYSAVKIYTDLRVRSFRNDSIYLQGTKIPDKRIQKAIEQGTERGLDFHQIIWVYREFSQLKFLYEEGVSVPKPLANAGLVIVMEFIGDGDIAAPRLSDISLEKDEAEEAFRQCLKILESFVRAGRIHGDLSGFNVLWNNGKAIVIDFPQVVHMNTNSESRNLLKRDIDSLCKSFRKFKLSLDPERIFRNMLSKVDYKRFTI